MLSVKLKGIMRFESFLHHINFVIKITLSTYPVSLHINEHCWKYYTIKYIDQSSNNELKYEDIRPT